MTFFFINVDSKWWKNRCCSLTRCSPTITDTACANYISLENPPFYWPQNFNCLSSSRLYFDGLCSGRICCGCFSHCFLCSVFLVVCVDVVFVDVVLVSVVFVKVVFVVIVFAVVVFAVNVVPHSIKRMVRRKRKQI